MPFLARHRQIETENDWQTSDFAVSVGFSLSPALASTTFRKIESFRKPESRKQLLMRILGGKKEKEAKKEEHTEEEANSPPELQSGQSDPLLPENQDGEGSGFELTPGLGDKEEQENQESIRSELAVPFQNDIKSSGLDLKESNVGKRGDPSNVDEEESPIIEPSFVSTVGSTSSVAVSLSPLELEVGNGFGFTSQLFVNFPDASKAERRRTPVGDPHRDFSKDGDTV